MEVDMINKEKLKALKNTNYSNDPLLKNVFDSIETLIEENKTLKRELKDLRWKATEEGDRRYP